MHSRRLISTPTIVVLFGITGDLVKRKILGAMYDLYVNDLLPKQFFVIGVSHRDLTNESMRAYLHTVLEEKKAVMPERYDEFLQRFLYLQADFSDPAIYKTLGEQLGFIDGEWKACSNKLFYLSVSPHLYNDIIDNLHTSGLTEPCGEGEDGWTRVILEKPFGTDLQQARLLDTKLQELFSEEQVYRVDHYLAKETVRNILAFRFSNTFLMPAWTRDSIESIDVRVTEEIDVEDRGAFYDGVGALRDFGQNHLLQLVALFTMENPGTFDANSVRKKRAQAMQHIAIMKSEEVEERTARGQYFGYIDTRGVKPDSQTETYFRAHLEILGGDLDGVPVSIEMGKALATARAEIIVTFKHVDPCFCKPENHEKNRLRYTMQPDEQIGISFLVKEPGHDYELDEQELLFDYKHAFGAKNSEPYEQVFLDIIHGDQTLFVSTEEAVREWEIVEPILQTWREQKKPTLQLYPRGATLDQLKNPSL